MFFLVGFYGKKLITRAEVPAGVSKFNGRMEELSKNFSLNSKNISSIGDS